MSVLHIPDPYEVDPETGELIHWPTLGPDVCDWIEEFCVFGPGDVRGEKAQIDDLKRALIYRFYEVFPKGHPAEGRRRFKRACVSMRKGTAKTELAAWLAIAELHPDAPVRCVGWKADGTPDGEGVQDPYIPLVAYTEEQTEELAYGAVYAILSEGPLADDFDIGLERIKRKDGTGRLVALASSPSARDGARTTWQHFDETHRFITPPLQKAHVTMMANIPKRRAADAWSLETTTMYAPGEESVAEMTHRHALEIADGKIKDPSLFFFHMEADLSHDLSTDEGLEAAIEEASGPATAWTDVRAIKGAYHDPQTDEASFRRLWLNQPWSSDVSWLSPEAWRAVEDLDFVVQRGDLVALGFDGSQYDDSTALIGCHIESGHLFVVQRPDGSPAIWEKPLGPAGDGWEVPRNEVDSAVRHAFGTYRVHWLYGDPPYWQSEMEAWQAEWPDQVVPFETFRPKQMAFALERMHTAVVSREGISHDGNAVLARHVANAIKREDRTYLTIRKPRQDRKIDAAVAATLAYEARCDAIAAGALNQRTYRAVSF